MSQGAQCPAKLAGRAETGMMVRISVHWPVVFFMLLGEGEGWGWNFEYETCVLLMYVGGRNGGENEIGALSLRTCRSRGTLSSIVPLSYAKVIHIQFFRKYSNGFQKISFHNKRLKGAVETLQWLGKCNFICMCGAGHCTSCYWAVASHVSWPDLTCHHHNQGDSKIFHHTHQENYLLENLNTLFIRSLYSFLER